MGLIGLTQIVQLRDLFWGRGRDQYSQTDFPSVQRITNLMLKGEDWVDITTGNLAKLYKTTPHLKAVIDRKAAMAANGRWKHYRQVGDKKEEVKNSKIVAILDKPNFMQSGTDFIMQRRILRSIYGNAFIFINRGLGKKPAKFWNLPAGCMSFERTGKLYHQIDATSVIARYMLNDFDGAFLEEFATEDIMHFRDWNPEDILMGLSKIEALMMSIANIRAALRFRNRIINSNAMLGILSTKAVEGMGIVTLDADEQKRVNKGLTRRYGMKEGQSDILQTEASVEWQAMSYPTKELMLFEEVDDDFKMIIDGFGLNANMFSFSKQSTFENMEHGIRLAYQDTIIPEGEAEAREFTAAFGLDGVTEWLELCYDHLDILKTDESETNYKNAQSIQVMLQAGMDPKVISEILDVEIGTITPPAPEPAPGPPVA